jgi:cell fate regulator YaaT (PSP1 superfamily)
MTDDQDKKESAYLPRSWGGGRRDKRIRQAATEPDELYSREDDPVEVPASEPESLPSSPVPHYSEQRADAEDRPEEPISAECDAAVVIENESEPIPNEAPVVLTPPPPCGPCRMHAEVEGVQEVLPSDAESTTVRVAGIRFGYACKIYHFDAGDMELNDGDCVIVKTEKGTGLGQVALAPFDRVMDKAQLEGLRRIVRKAGRADFDQKTKCSQKESEAFNYCLDRIEVLGLPMKLVAVECFFDGTKYVFYFTAEGRVDFRELVKQLVARFPVRIEMRQIGVRHEAKMTGGIACCGQELCCSRFLIDFRPVSVRMAKNQNLSLNPTKISGVCGRLMCCLAYEHDIYEEFKRGLPRVGKAVMTPQGEGVVVKHSPLAETIFVRFPDESVEEIPRDQIVLGAASATMNRQGEADSSPHDSADCPECAEDDPPCGWE